MTVRQPTRDRRHDGDHHGPWRHEDPGLNLGAMKHVLEVERQRHEGQSLHRERTDRGGDRQREDRPAKQIDRQHRRGVTGLTAQQQCAEDHSTNQFRNYDTGCGAVRGAADSEDEKAEADSGQQCAGNIEGMAGARCLWQGPHTDQQRGETERNVDREQPWPCCDRQNARCERRTKRESGGNNERVVAEPASMHP